MADTQNWLQKAALRLVGLDPQAIADQAKKNQDDLLSKYGLTPATQRAIESELRNRITSGVAGQVADWERVAGAQLGYQRGVNNNTLQLEEGRAGVQGQLVRNNTEAIGERTQFATDRDLANIAAGADATIRVMDPVHVHEQTTLDKFGAMYDKTLAAQAADRQAMQALAGQQNVLNMLKGFGAIGLGLLT